MIKIVHRVNKVEKLKGLASQFGAEIDVRYHNNDLILQHDPFRHHEDPNIEHLQEFLDAFSLKGPLILNVKTEGIEEECIRLMNQSSIKNWFFLDLSMPYFVKYAIEAQSRRRKDFTPENLATRFSEFEPLEYALSFSGKAHWVWVDCFSKYPLDEKSYQTLKAAGFKLCLVSPELQGHPVSKIPEFQSPLVGMKIDAVCTKRPDLWDK